MITRRHFRPMWRPGDLSAPPPLHVESARADCNWAPLPRPLEAGGQPGPSLVLGGPAFGSYGIDPTDPGTWAGRGYSQSPGMIGLPDLNQPPAMNSASGSAVPRGRQR